MKKVRVELSKELMARIEELAHLSRMEAGQLVTLILSAVLVRSARPKRRRKLRR